MRSPVNCLRNIDQIVTLDRKPARRFAPNVRMFRVLSMEWR
jgi:hypothetical protein